MNSISSLRESVVTFISNYGNTLCLVGNGSLLVFWLFSIGQLFSTGLSQKDDDDPSLRTLEDHARTAATILLTTLIIQHSIDDLAWSKYPRLQFSSLWKLTAHWLIIFSLLPNTHLLVLSSKVVREIGMSLSHILMFLGFYCEVQSRYSRQNTLPRVTFFLTCSMLSETFYISGLKPKNDHHHDISLILNMLLMVEPVFHFIQGHFQHMWKQQKYPALIIYLSFYLHPLLDGLNIVLLSRGSMEWRTCTTASSSLLGQRILGHIVFVVLTAVLPGRLTRRGLLVAEEKDSILREMNYKKTFVRYISHEVRSPLSTTSLGLDCMIDMLDKQHKQLLQQNADTTFSMTSFASMPQQNSNLLAELLELAQDCKTTCVTAIQTLSDLLLYDKVESKMLQLECTDLGCLDFLDHCVHPLEKHIKLSGLIWESHLDERIQEAVVCADQVKLEQVLRNFISNAIKFTCSGGRISLRASVYIPDNSSVLPSPSPPTVEITSANSSSSDISSSAVDKQGNMRGTAANSATANPQEQFWVRVEVSDTGPGIAPENVQKLFGQYVQFDANKLQKGGGSGLGLWLSKAIVEAHGGRVGARSAGLGKGSTFYFELPIKEMIIAAPPADSQSDVAGVVGLMEDEEEVHQICDDDFIALSSSSSPGSSMKRDHSFLWPSMSTEIVDYVSLEPEVLTAGGVDGRAEGKNGGEMVRVDTLSSITATPALASSKNVDPVVEWSWAVIDGVDPARPVLNFLLADDSPLARKMVDKLLQSNTFTVRVAKPPKEEKAKQTKSEKRSRKSKKNGADRPPKGASTPGQTLTNSGKPPIPPSSPAVVPEGEEKVEWMANVSSPDHSVPSRSSSRTSVSSNSAPTSRKRFNSAQASARSSLLFPSPVSSACNSPAAQRPKILSLSIPSPSSALPASAMSKGTESGKCQSVSPSPSSSSSSSSSNPGVIAISIEVDHAANGQICVDLVNRSLLPWRKAYDVILIDYYMPVMDGEQAIRQLRSIGYKGCIFALTAVSNDCKEDSERLVKAGATAVLTKPFDVQVFQRLLHQHYQFVPPPPAPNSSSGSLDRSMEIWLQQQQLSTPFHSPSRRREEDDRPAEGAVLLE
eukprot:gene11029-12279_t